MRVLSISGDRKIFDAESAVRFRQKTYAEALGNLDCIVFSLSENGNKAFTEDGLTVAPTNSVMRILYGLDAYFVARRMQKPDIVTAQDPLMTGLAALMIARHFSTPLHVQMHSDLSALGWFKSRLALFVLRRASGIRVVLERTKDELEASGVTVPISVIPIYVDTERYAELVRVKHPRWKIAFLCVGRLEPEKRFDRAIDALFEVRKKGHDAGLTIVGAGSLERSLKERVRGLRLDNYVEFAGWQNDITQYLKTADCLLVTSEYEGYGMVIVEALSAGVPVFSTDVGIAREAGAIVVQPRDFTQELLHWIQSGPRSGALALVLPASFEAYVQSIVEDWSACEYIG